MCTQRHRGQRKVCEMMHNDMEHSEDHQQNRNRSSARGGPLPRPLNAFVAQGAQSGFDVIADPAGSGQIDQNYGMRQSARVNIWPHIATYSIIARLCSFAPEPAVAALSHALYAVRGLGHRFLLVVSSRSS
jgi:hypothetical protein